MKVNTDSNHIYTTQRAQTSTAAGTKLASFSSALSAVTAESSTAKQADFNSMTRKEMSDWMNNQIRSGKMSLDESSPFLGMSLKISVATGQPVDLATDRYCSGPIFSSHSHLCPHVYVDRLTRYMTSLC